MPVSTVKIVNRLGLHARAASRLVALAKTFSSDITLHRADRSVTAKSIMSVMLLDAPAGTEIDLEVTGVDAAQAELAVLALFHRGFDEDTDHA